MLDSNENVYTPWDAVTDNMYKTCSLKCDKMLIVLLKLQIQIQEIKGKSLTSSHSSQTESLP